MFYWNDKAKNFGWSLELDVGEWVGCIFEETTLIQLDCYDNGIVVLPDLSNCVSLKHLDCSINYIEKLPDLSKCVSLERLECSVNRLVKLPDLRPCLSLLYLECFTNAIREEPKVPSNLRIYSK